MAGGQDRRRLDFWLPRRAARDGSTPLSLLADSLQATALAQLQRTSLSLKNKDLFPALDMPAAQNNKALNERSSTTLQAQASAYFCHQTYSVSLFLFILPEREFKPANVSAAHRSHPTCSICKHKLWRYAYWHLRDQIYS